MHELSWYTIQMPRKFRTREGKEYARKRFFSRAVFITCICFFVCAVLIAVSWVQALRITHVRVIHPSADFATDVERVISEQLTGMTWWGAPRDSVFMYHGGVIQEVILSQFPIVAETRITREGADGIVAHITERTPSAYWCGDVVPPDIVFRNTSETWGTCFFVDADGFIFAQASTTDDVPLVRYYGALSHGSPIGQFVAPREEFERIMWFTKEMHTADYSIVALLFVDERDVEFVLEDGTWVRILRDDSVEVVIERMRSVFLTGVIDTTKEIEYVDMRFGNKVYVKYLATEALVDETVDALSDAALDVESDVDVVE